MSSALKHRASRESGLKRDFEKLIASAEHSPGVYDVMRLYAQYQKILEQSRAYLVRGHVFGFSSSDRTG